MKYSHTPGPWEMDSEACFISQHGDVLLMVGQVRGWGWLHRKYGEKEAFEIQKANGKLMAAAPTMYEYISEMAAIGDDKAIELLKYIDGTEKR